MTGVDKPETQPHKGNYDDLKGERLSVGGVSEVDVENTILESE